MTDKILIDSGIIKKLVVQTNKEKLEIIRRNSEIDQLYYKSRFRETKQIGLPIYDKNGNEYQL